MDPLLPQRGTKAQVKAINTGAESLCLLVCNTRKEMKCPGDAGQQGTADSRRATRGSGLVKGPVSDCDGYHGKRPQLTVGQYLHV